MAEITIIGLDLAKTVFHAVCCDRHGNEVGKKTLRQATRKDSALSRWVCCIQARRGTHKAIVALANKLARIGWAGLRHDGSGYQPARAVC